MNPGDGVEVTNRDGETSQGTVRKVLSVTASQYHFVPYGDGEDDELTSIAEFWQSQCDPDAKVVIVEIVDEGGELVEFAYPDDKVEVIES